MALAKSGQVVSNTLKSWRDKALTRFPKGVYNAGYLIKGRCFGAVCAAWNPVGPLQKTAYLGWLATPEKYRHTDPTKAPVGAVHYYVNHDFKGDGHATVQTDVLYHEWSTDTPNPGRIGIQAHSYFTAPYGWNMHYLGWTNWLAGSVLPIKALPTIKPSGPDPKK